MRVGFRWAQAYGYIEANPAGEAIDGALVTVPRLKAHHAALPHEEVPGALRELDRYRGFQEPHPWASTLLCFKFLILTATRSAEARGGGTVGRNRPEGRRMDDPGAPDEGGKAHRVPLSIQAPVLLGMARDELGDPGGLVFPTPGGRVLSGNALSLRARKDGMGCVPHGFRSSFRDWAQECTSASHATTELSQAHAPGGAVEMAYFRSDLLDQRRELMQSWADYLAPLPF